MIVLGVILLILGFVLTFPVLIWIGVALAILGCVLMFSGHRLY